MNTKKRTSENRKVTLAIGQLRGLVWEGGASSISAATSSGQKEIWTVVTVDKSREGYYITTMSFENDDEAVRECMDELANEYTGKERAFEEERESIEEELNEQGFYQTGNTEYWIEETTLFTK